MYRPRFARPFFETVNFDPGTASVLASVVSIASAAKGFFSKPEKPPAAPAPTPVEKTPVMPTTDAEAVTRARRRAVAERTQKSGVLSTILTSDSQKLGA